MDRNTKKAVAKGCAMTVFCCVCAPFILFLFLMAGKSTDSKSPVEVRATTQARQNATSTTQAGVKSMWWESKSAKDLATKLVPSANYKCHQKVVETVASNLSHGLRLEAREYLVSNDCFNSDWSYIPPSVRISRPTRAQLIPHSTWWDNLNPKSLIDIMIYNMNINCITSAWIATREASEEDRWWGREKLSERRCFG